MEQLIAVLIPVLLLAIVIKVLTTPIKWIFKLLCHAAMGFVCLFLLNQFTVYTGITFELTPVTCLVSGIGGVPGVVVLALMQLYGL